MSRDLKLDRMPPRHAVRDAIHVAVAPVIADVLLQPGTHVGIVSENRVGPSASPIGIVNPFLTSPVNQGGRVWLLLYPGSITSLRHDWTHPAFGETDNQEVRRQEARKWLAMFARKVGLSYQELLTAAKRYQESGDYHCLSFDTPEICYQEREAFWANYEIATGEPADPGKRDSFFRCAC